jgi:hypothetical protein
LAANADLQHDKFVAANARCCVADARDTGKPLGDDTACVTALQGGATAVH